MHSKIHYADGQEELLRATDGVLARLVDPGRLVKAASTSAFTEDEIRAHLPDKDHFMCLYIGMGASERYGPNKNNDWWSREALTKKAHTFVDNGHYFREHRNRSPELKIGDIKAARFDPLMDRVEIIVHGHKKKASREFERALAGKELSSSMSARVPEDVCRCCGNRAPSPAHYCSHLTDTPGQYLEEFQKYANADNPDPTFFDLSDVERPADRIARFLQYRFHGDDAAMAKAASSNLVVSGAEWASFEGLNLPSDPLFGDVRRRGLLQKLATIEGEFSAAVKQASLTVEKSICQHAAAGLAGQMSDSDIDVLRQQRPPALFAHLAKVACVLPFPEFTAYISGLPRADVLKLDVFQKAAGCLPNLFRDMLQGCLAPDEFFAGSMDLMDVGGCKDDVLQPVLERMIERFHCMAGPVADRAVKSASSTALRSDSSDTVSTAARQLAHCYGLYKLSSLLDMERFHGSEFSSTREAILVGHNFACAPSVDMPKIV